MHTPVELVAVRDVQRAGACRVHRAQPDFMTKVIWDDDDAG
jgi:hypothetical protein